MIKNISSFTDKKKIQSAAHIAMSGILITPDKIVATDSYKLIEVKQINPITDSTLIVLPKGLKSFDFARQTPQGYEVANKGTITRIDAIMPTKEYPQYEAIMPTAVPVRTITLSVAHLKDIIEAYHSAKKDQVTLSFYEHAYNPVKFTIKDESITALLMPIYTK